MKRWLKSTAFKISIVLFVISILLSAVSFILIASSSVLIGQGVYNIVVGVSTNLLGIIITVSFVQFYLDKNAKRQEEVDEYKKILRYDKYAKILIREYMNYFNSVVTPLEKRNHLVTGDFVHDFRLSDMADMYTSTIFLKDRLYTPVIERFYECEEELFCYFERMLEEIDFKYAEDLGNLLIGFITKSKEQDVKKGILGQQQLFLRNKKGSDSITEEMRHPTRDYVSDYLNGQLSSHIMIPFVQLFFYLRMQRDFIENYMDEIGKISQKYKDMVLENNSNEGVARKLPQSKAKTRAKDYSNMSIDQLVNELMKKCSLRKAIDYNVNEMQCIYSKLSGVQKEVLNRYLCNNRMSTDKIPQFSSLMLVILPVFAILFTLETRMTSIVESTISAQYASEFLLKLKDMSFYLFLIVIFAWMSDFVFIMVNNYVLRKKRFVTEVISMLHEAEVSKTINKKPEKNNNE